MQNNSIKQQNQSSHFVMNVDLFTNNHNLHHTNLYQCVMQYHQYTQTSEHIRQAQYIKNFIKYKNNKVLFIFGPTGCGKHVLLINFLIKNKIAYKIRSQQIIYNQNVIDDNWENNTKMYQNQYRVKNIKQFICQALSNSDNQIKFVQIYQDFPIDNTQSSPKQLQANKIFRSHYFQQIRTSNIKQIFLLNSDIYNRYYILPKTLPQQITQIIMKPYTNSQIKSIVKNFTMHYKMFQWIRIDKDIMDEIMEISNGDIRKILLNMYRYYLDQQHNKTGRYMDKCQKAEHKLKIKNQQKFTLFHLLGKYLYAKRYDVLQKKDRYFSREQLNNSDPPFYFNPVDVYIKSKIPLNIFSQQIQNIFRLLFQNYLTKITQISDAKQISKLFSHLDSCYPQFITNKKIDIMNQISQIQYIFQLTWGIILKNKSSSSINKNFGSFKRSQNGQVMRQVKNKRELLKKYFPFKKLHQLVTWGYIVKTSKVSKNYLISSIIKKRNRWNRGTDEGQKNINQQQQEQIIKDQLKEGEDNFIQLYLEKKKFYLIKTIIMKEIENQEDDDSDIEEDDA